MLRNVLLVLAAMLIGCLTGAGFVAASTAKRSLDREEKFLDECQWAPAVTQPDGSIPARAARNAYPLCYLELVKAKTVSNQTVVQQPVMQQQPPLAPIVPPKK